MFKIGADMTHAEFIKTLSTKRGARSEYAQKLGLSLSFLWQIENRRAVTPKRCYENVILLTNGRVSVSDLISETRS